MSRRAWTILLVALVLLGVGAGAVAAVLGNGGGPETAPQATATRSVPGSFDLPLARKSNTLAVAKHRGNLLVGIAAQAGGPVEIAAVRGEKPVAVEVAVDGRALGPQSCGRACSRIQAPVLDGRTSSLSVEAGGTRVSFRLPRRLPPSGARVFDRARRTMAGLSSYRFTERLSSGGPTVRSRIDVQAPDRLRLRTGSYRSVIIGKTRWDFHDGRWERGPFPGLAVRDALMWYHARTPRILERRPNGAAVLAAFGVLPVPAWFRLTVEPSGRVSQAEMTAASHFMLHRYSAFDHGASIEPPR